MGRPKQLIYMVVVLGSLISAIWCWPFGPLLDMDVTPRITVHINGLLGCNRFHGAAVNYSSLLLEDASGFLYVGAREAIYKMDTTNISDTNNTTSLEWAASAEQKKQCLSKGKNNKTECYNHVRFLDRYNDTHLYTCGTHAFRPRCAYIDVARFTFGRFEEGKEKCPYDPTKGYTGFIIDGEMYSASQYEFRNIPDIRRNFPFPNLRTDDSPTSWLLEADFVGSAFLRESANSSIGDDDKLYFFFTEKNVEPTAYSSQTKVARVARVCKGDIGGQRTLQRKWTSFLKARLVCSISDYELQLNVLRSVHVVEAADIQDTVFYGIFGFEWRNVKMSAVCQYSLRDVQAAFDGPYMELQDSKWKEYAGNVPDPRPGSCITDQHRGLLINSSRDLPDNVLNFARKHPLMSRQIQPVGGRPLLFQKSVDYTKITVHRVMGLDGRIYDMLFIGTDEGWLHRAVKIRDHVHIIDELQLFEEKQPINNLVISQRQESIYVSAPSGLVQVPLSSCERYTSCFDCVFARDPLCGWDGRVCAEVSFYPNRSSLIQDVQMGSRGCTNITSDGFVTHRTRVVMAGDDVLLQCEIRSNLASPRWTLNGQQLQGYAVDFGYRTGTDGLLIIGAQGQQSGHYRCYAVENGIWVPVRSYVVRVQPVVSPPASHLSQSPTALPESFFTTATVPTPSHSGAPVEKLLSPPPAPLPSGPEFQTYSHMEAMYISLVAVLGGLCLVLTVVLLYVSFSARISNARKYSQQGLSLERKRSSHFELETLSSHCNGRPEGRSRAVSRDGEFLQIVPVDIQSSPSKEPPAAPPLPMPPPLPSSEYANGLSSTLPSMLRKMNGNSYMLLNQTDSGMTSPLCHSFTEELNRILEKRKHTQLDDIQPDESSV